MAARKVLKRASLAGAASAGCAAVWWERRRQGLLQDYEVLLERYRDTGSDSRFPWYGRDWGYEVDYFIELGLDAGDVLRLRYNIAALPPHQAAALAVVRWYRSLGGSMATSPGSSTSGTSVGSGAAAGSAGAGEPMEVVVDCGQKYIRHPPRPPAAWWMPWWPRSTCSQVSKYCDWLAWHPVVEAWALPRKAALEAEAKAEERLGDPMSRKRRLGFTIR
eukprot:TRINITY_DN38306_c0_g1_i1.p3 TRINITY_DN38306_c0_g1~~TRINITY_DN38306_c0_g1_i1.p3  ORF type:complete len:219 (-),score=50.59 TRINITY_DN38306_c0_g1_i1:316-972(-)